jgi:proteasome lid subunit RPN8/RPN11
MQGILVDYYGMRVRRRVLDTIRSHARREFPHECCGLLVGADMDVVEAIPTRNVAAEPLSTYEVSPEDHFAVIRACRTAPSPSGVIGGYHSHPRSVPQPSPTDLERAFSEFLYVIAGPVEDEGEPDVRGFRLRDGRFVPVTLEIVE